MKRAIALAALITAVFISGCSLLEQPAKELAVDGYEYYGDYYKDHYRRPIEIRGAIATMPSEEQGPICGTTGVDYCRNLMALTSVPYETDIATVRWYLNGIYLQEGDDLESFPYNFQTTGEQHIRIEIVDEFGREAVYDGPFRVVSPRSDYVNPWYSL